MNRVRAGILGLLTTPSLVLSGCGYFQNQTAVVSDPSLNYYQTAATQVEYVDEVLPDQQASSTPAPLTLLNDTPEFREISLQECIQLALQNNQVMRDLGGVVLRSPASAQTIFNPAVQETEPRLGLGLVGPEAALSAFDASFAASAFVDKVERADNNSTLVNTFPGPSSLKQDLGTFQAELSKVAATGARFSVRNTTEYDANNATLNTFASSWALQYEMEARQPLLQGGGIDFNRIAGPQAVPGIYTGILLARINTDIALSDFELSVRNMVNDVENAYLDLYYAYRDLDSKVAARDAALETWRSVNALYELERKGGEAFREAQAREQYFRFQEEVQNSLQGPLFQGTSRNNGSSGGTFRASGGVMVAERRLRLLIGLPVTDGSLMRPAEEPEMAEVIFDWQEVLQEALTRRVEIRKQKWNIKSRQLELQASQNFLLPRLDLVGRYNWRGFGHDLFRQHDQAAATRDVIDSPDNLNSRFETSRFNNAYDNLFNGDFQGLSVGAEFSMPLGFRRGYAGVANAEFRLARDMAILREQEREIAHDLSNAIADVKRAYVQIETNYNRRLAAKQQLDAVQAAYDADTAGAELDEVLDSQRRLADAESNYYRSLIEYAYSIKNMHFEKGSLLDYNGIYLEEGPWPHKAYEDAARKRDLRCRPWQFGGLLQPGPVISSGPAPQLVLPQPGSNFEADQAPVTVPPLDLENPAAGNQVPRIDTAEALPDLEGFKPGFQSQVPSPIENPFANSPPDQSRLVEILPAPRN
jgi:outer membrane protein TolC